MDRRIKFFLADVLALAGKTWTRTARGVARGALADCEAILRAQEEGSNKRMRDQAARVCRALCRTRVAEELQRRRGTRILALSIIDRQQER